MIKKKKLKNFKINFSKENLPFWTSYFNMAGIKLKEGCYECKIINGKTDKNNDNVIFECELLNNLESEQK